MAHRVPVSKPLGDGTYGLPSTTKIRTVNLPGYLQPGHVLTQDDLDAINAVDLDDVKLLIESAKAETLALVNEMLANVGGHAAYVFQQTVPTASVVVHHNLGRQAVAVNVFSLDYETQYEFFEMYPLDPDNVQLAFDDPIAFVALVI